MTPHCLMYSFVLSPILDQTPVSPQEESSDDTALLFTSVPLSKTEDCLCGAISKRNLAVFVHLPGIKDLIFLCAKSLRFDFEG